MNWNEFAKKIDGELKDKSNGFVLGDTIEKELHKEWEDRKITIKKKIRRSYGESSLYNVEKIEFDYLIKTEKYGKSRIRRKKLFGRIGKKVEAQYDVEGDQLEVLKNILPMEELQYLLKYPKSEFILLGSMIKFKSRSIGEMKEEIGEIFDSIEALRQKLGTSANTAYSDHAAFENDDRL